MDEFNSNIFRGTARPSRRFQGGPGPIVPGPLLDGGPGPMEDPGKLAGDYAAMAELAEKAARIDGGILNVEQHIIDVIMAERGASNINLLTQALVNIKGLEGKK